MFRYVEDKDMFQRFYTRTLSRRLVQHISLSMEAEESMIQKLKVYWFLYYLYHVHDNYDIMIKSV